MGKEILFGKTSRDRLLSGVKKITDAVRVTMGASGKCVLIGEMVYHEGWQHQLPTKVTKDGWTVTRYFELQDPIENRGAMMIKEAATKTVEEVGDATTCTCVLAESLITNGMKLIDEGANSQQLKKGMDAALEYVVAELKKISTPVRGDNERIRQIATVSANNDKAIGDLIAEAYSKIGDDGVIDIEPSKGINTEIKISDGFKFDRGWVSPFFVTNKAKESCEFENALIVLYEKKVTHHTQIERAIEISMQQGKPLVIICEDADEEGLAFLAMNNIQKRIRVCVVKSPEYAELRREMMEDIALLTGGTYIGDTKGVGVKEIELRHFGEAKKVVISKTETVIIGGKNDAEQLTDFVNDLKMNLAQAKTEEEKFPIEKRIARLTGGVAVIQVGAATETEMKYLKDKLEDAVNATKAAIAEGIVPGGGAALAKDRVDDAVRATKAAISEGFVAGGGVAFAKIDVMIEKTAKTDYGKGWVLINGVLKTPFKQICINAGVDGDEKLKEIIWKEQNIGYNVLTGEITDMVDSGVIDSTKALRCALTNAVSVAGMLLTSECSIITIN